MMVTPRSRHLWLALFVFAALIIPIWTSYAQEGTPTPQRKSSESQTVLASTTTPAAPAHIQPQAAHIVYLPLVIASPSASALQFATATNPDGSLANPGTVFGYGATRLYVSTVVQHGDGLPWKIEWTWPDGYVLTDAATINGSPDRITRYIYFSDNSPLDRGTYQVKFFLNNQLVQQSTAEIR